MKAKSVPQFKVQKREYGWFAMTENALLGFGNAKSTPELLAAEFPSLQFHYLTQVHSNRVLNFDALVSSATEADGHIATKPKQALAIKTADCLPVLILSNRDPIVAAIHAGWRGLEGEIIVQAISKFVAAGYMPSEFYVFIGPHISAQHYEVDEDVAKKLSEAYKKVRFDQTASMLLPHPKQGKAFADLTKLALGQLKISGVPEGNIHVMKENTFTDTNFHSARRDRELAGRQISFISLL